MFHKSSFCKLLVVLVCALTLFAGTTPTLAEDWVVERFEAGGRSHLLRYRTDITDAATVAQAAREAIEQSVSIYQPLWNAASGLNASDAVGFQIFINVQTHEDSDSLATALMISPTELPEGISSDANTVCQVRIFEQSGNAVSVLLATLAHEVAHCYQRHYTGLTSDTPLPAERWWREGTAEWLATLVYPELAASYLAQTGIWDGFNANYNHYLFDNAYEMVYLWQFLATGEGFGSSTGLLKFLMLLPNATSAAEYANLLQSNLDDLDAVFHNYAIAVGRKQLDYLPADLLVTGYTASSLPFQQAITTDSFSINLIEIGDISLPADKPLMIEVSGLDAAGIRASIVLENGTTLPLLESSPIQVCPAPSKLNVVLSRADGDTSAADPLIHLSESSDPCEPQQLAQPPDCLVGTWYLTILPPQLAELVQYEIDEYTFIIEQNGDYTALLNITATTNTTDLQTSVWFHATLSGHLTLAVDPAQTKGYAVLTVTSNLHPDSVAVATVNGNEMDVTDMMAGMMESSGFFPPPTYLACVHPNRMESATLINGSEYVWIFDR